MIKRLAVEHKNGRKRLEEKIFYKKNVQHSFISNKLALRSFLKMIFLDSIPFIVQDFDKSFLLEFLLVSGIDIFFRGT